MISQKKAKENFIVATMSKLGIDRGEAEELYNFDHDEISNPVVDKIEAKTAKVKEKAPSTIGKVLTMKAKKKADLNKETIISNLFDFYDLRLRSLLNKQETSFLFKIKKIFDIFENLF